jgi:hypothetical protein
MIEVFKVFYPTHYNFAAVSLLLVLLIIYLLTKKNFKWSLIFLAILMAFNIFIYKRTADKVWTITIAPEKSSDPYSTPQAQKMTFSVKHNWTITDEKGEVHHWCWVEAYWESFAGTDIIAKLWGSESKKKMIESTESRASDINE